MFTLLLCNLYDDKVTNLIAEQQKKKKKQKGTTWIKQRKQVRAAHWKFTAMINTFKMATSYLTLTNGMSKFSLLKKTEDTSRVQGKRIESLVCIQKTKLRRKLKLPKIGIRPVNTLLELRRMSVYPSTWREKKKKNLK